MKQSKPGEIVIKKAMSAKELSEFLELKARQVSQLTSDGVFKKNPQGDYPLKQSVVAYISHLQTSNDDPGSPELREKKLFEEHRKLKRENDIEEYKVAPVSEITKALSLVSTEIGKVIDSIPGIIASTNRDISGRSIEKIEKELIGVKNRIADVPEQVFTSEG